MAALGASVCTECTAGVPSPEPDEKERQHVVQVLPQPKLIRNLLLNVWELVDCPKFKQLKSPESVDTDTADVFNTVHTLRDHFIAFVKSYSIHSHYQGQSR
jgi:hypothetical protein